MPQNLSPDQILALATVCCGVGPGGSTSMLAKVCIVDHRGHVVLDVFVKPTMEVSDFRTATTGIERQHLFSTEAMAFPDVQARVGALIKNKIVVGHCLWQDLSVLGIPHAAAATRDVALYQPFRNSLQSPNQAIGLQTLMWHFMRRRCQGGQLNALENARAAMDLYRSVAATWEAAAMSGTWPCALPPNTYARCYL